MTVSNNISYLIFHRLPPRDLTALACASSDLNVEVSQDRYWQPYLKEIKFVKLIKGHYKEQYINFIRRYCDQFAVASNETNLFSRKVIADQFVAKLSLQQLNGLLSITLDCFRDPIILLAAGAKPTLKHLEQALQKGCSAEAVTFMIKAGSLKPTTKMFNEYLKTVNASMDVAFSLLEGGVKPDETSIRCFHEFSEGKSHDASFEKQHLRMIQILFKKRGGEFDWLDPLNAVFKRAPIPTVRFLLEKADSRLDWKLSNFPLLPAFACGPSLFFPINIAGVDGKFGLVKSPHFTAREFTFHKALESYPIEILTLLHLRVEKLSPEYSFLDMAILGQRPQDILDFLIKIGIRPSCNTLNLALLCGYSSESLDSLQKAGAVFDLNAAATWASAPKPEEVEEKWRELKFTSQLVDLEGKPFNKADHAQNLMKLIDAGAKARGQTMDLLAAEKDYCQVLKRLLIEGVQITDQTLSIAQQAQQPDEILELLEIRDKTLRDNKVLFEENGEKITALLKKFSPEADIEDEFICPLSFGPMAFPVKDECGNNDSNFHSYEKSWILKALKDKEHCPLSRKPLNEHYLAPNLDLQKRILDWLTSQIPTEPT